MLESVTQQIVSTILSTQANRPGGGLVTISIDSTMSGSPAIKLEVNLPQKNVTLSQMQRIRRQFSSLHKLRVTEMSEGTLANMFVDYAEGALRS